ncbi:MAG: hypothetical protein MHMPM18_003202 [Marteilia pararefringens]
MISSPNYDLPLTNYSDEFTEYRFLQPFGRPDREPQSFYAGSFTAFFDSVAKSDNSVGIAWVQTGDEYKNLAILTYTRGFNDEKHTIQRVNKLGIRKKFTDTIYFAYFENGAKLPPLGAEELIALSAEVEVASNSAFGRGLMGNFGQRRVYFTPQYYTELDPNTVYESSEKIENATYFWFLKKTRVCDDYINCFDGCNLLAISSF